VTDEHLDVGDRSDDVDRNELRRRFVFFSPTLIQITTDTNTHTIHIDHRSTTLSDVTLGVGVSPAKPTISPPNRKKFTKYTSQTTGSAEWARCHQISLI